MSERCLICGKEIPEGRQVCPICEKGVRKRKTYLMPCPFCGGPASFLKVQFPDGSTNYEVDCENNNCECSACTALHDTPEEAAAVWNRRPGGPCSIPEDEKKYTGLIEEE